MKTYDNYVDAPHEPCESGRRVNIFGPPGTGKTTFLQHKITDAALEVGGDHLLVASFTRAAARELVSRNLPLKDKTIGTLHAHCYRALDGPTLAETQTDLWNRDRPRYKLTISAGDLEEPEPDLKLCTFGDQLYAQQQILRARMEALESWPTAVRRFHEEWTEWKRSHKVLDFTDLIETALRDFKIAPGFPRVLVIDEAQDLSRLQFKLVTQWSRHTEYALIAADDDQTIFSFAGADPAVLLEGDDEASSTHVLSQSYRVPRAIHTLSQAWIQKVSLRKAKDYKPRDADGQVRLFNRGNYRYVDAIVKDAEQYLRCDKTVMFLASCSYILEPLKRFLRERGLPFHNPYRPQRTDWSPLSPRFGSDSISPVERLLSYLRPRDEMNGGGFWSGEDMRRWSAWLPPNEILRSHAAQVIKEMSERQYVSREQLHELFEPDAALAFVTAVCGGPLDAYIRWWLNRLPMKRRRLVTYPAKVATQCGVHALTDRPQIIIGTGHSVKGGEADVVYIFPDLSASGMRQWSGHRRERDALIRLAYVMMTRARETLVVCGPASYSHMPIAPAAARLARH